MQFQEAPRKSSNTDSDDLVWSPKKAGHGPLIGTLTERKTGLVSKFGGSGEVLKIVDDNGEEWTVLAFAARLLDCLEAFDPQVGDRVGVSFEGSEMRDNGHSIDNYKMGVERAATGSAVPAAPSVPAPSADSDLPF